MVRSCSGLQTTVHDPLADPLRIPWRAGAKVLDESRIYVCWGELNVDLLGLDDRQPLIAALAQRYPGDEGTGR